MRVPSPYLADFMISSRFTSKSASIDGSFRKVHVQFFPSQRQEWIMFVFCKRDVSIVGSCAFDWQGRVHQKYQWPDTASGYLCIDVQTMRLVVFMNPAVSRSSLSVHQFSIHVSGGKIWTLRSLYRGHVCGMPSGLGNTAMACERPKVCCLQCSVQS